MLLSIENLTFAWLNETLFENISMKVGTGQIIVLKGENGCGKSTFLQIMAGMIPHFSRGRILKGDVLLENQSIIHSTPSAFFP
ncbi:ATP-binding cassette domain-containing protein, partial [candidate division KSB1 bacterium]|nr:ATP-binding cassette domain-containing protein [candidate division KSB1 bacterium]